MSTLYGMRDKAVNKHTTMNISRKGMHSLQAIQYYINH